MRHYVRLSQKNYAIDMGIYPLGSCTMKHNPRLNEQVARLPGFADIHPLQPVSSVQGALELIHELGRWLIEITGMHSVAMSPKAGAHGELCGMMAIKAALAARGETRSQGAGAGIGARHQSGDRGAARLFGASPCRRARTARCARRTCASCSPSIEGQVAAIMLTNPNTCGIFEPEVGGDRRGRARGRRLFLLRRRQPQRHHGQGEAGRARRRRHAHQPAQDLLHAAWRRRAGRRAGGAVGGARAVRAGALRRRATATAIRLVEHAGGRRRRQAASAA